MATCIYRGKKAAEFTNECDHHSVASDVTLRVITENCNSSCSNFEAPKIGFSELEQNMLRAKYPSLALQFEDDTITSTFAPLPILDKLKSNPASDFPSLTTPTNTDPNGTEQHKAGAKLDAGKPDMSLLLMFGKALHEVSRVGTGGKIKYSRGGWQEVDDGINRYTAAMLRHIFQEHYEDIDQDLTDYMGQDIYHAASVCWNSLARLELMMREKTNAKSI